MPDLVLGFLKSYYLVRARAEHGTRLIVQFVVNLRAVEHHLAELIPEKVRIVLLTNHLHVFYLMNRADDSETQEAVIRIIDKVLRVQNGVGYISDAQSHKLTVNPVNKVVASEPRINAFILALAALVNFLIVVWSLPFGDPVVSLELRIVNGRAADESPHLFAVPIFLVHVHLVSPVDIIQLFTVCRLAELNRV